ncbi:MAG: radical SAM protein [Candidatus Bathyarchaeota archaeon]|nr:radical SAM protein [Candidatus Bathyarchaeota archaeon A05DMB-5]MDH7558315.1 radical SAM protein [Candidatus Bathyarchaeota archaeon]
MTTAEQLPSRIRVSLGSAIVLGLLKGKLDAAPTTIYLMTYREGKCSANCGFCPQARKSRGRADMLSRVSWPTFTIEQVLDGIENAVENGKVKRVCIQALNYPQVFNDLIAIVKAIHRRVGVPISISCQPLNSENLRRLAKAGAERVGIPLDAATEELFNKVKGIDAGGPYNWKQQFGLLNEAVNVFGKGKVSTHLIVGLGETEKEMVHALQTCVDMGVLPALFAFTPISGTALENKAQPPIERYRRVQIARHLIIHGIARYEKMRFDEEGNIQGFGVDEKALWQIAQTGEPFRTSGCPSCNRPYYNEKPRGPLFNYPNALTKEELVTIWKQLGLHEAQEY